MFSEKSWRTDALVRLFASVLISIFFLGTLGSSVLRVLGAHGASRGWFFWAAAGGGFACFAATLVVLHLCWQPEKLLRKLGWLAAFFYGGFLAMWLASRFAGGAQVGVERSTAGILVAVLSFQGMALVFVHGFLREHGMGWVEAFGLRHNRLRAVMLGAAVAVAAIPVGWGLQLVSGMVLDWLRITAHEQTAVEALRVTSATSSRVVLGFATILLVPAAEEVLFRGVLYPWIKQAGFPRLAAWLTAVLFGAIHGNLAIFVPLTALALALVWLYEHTGNLLAPICAHSIFNALNFIMLYAGDTFPHLPGPK